MTTLEVSQLRKFGLTLAFTFIGLFGLTVPYISQHAVPWWPWLLGVTLISLSWWQTPWLRFIYTPWMKVGHILGWFNTRVILAILFFVLIMPIGLIRRWLGNDSMARTFDKNLTSYRILALKRPKEQMERPF